MKINGLEWMDWLHKMRADRERERREAGVSEEDAYRASLDRGRKLMAAVHEHAEPPAVHDKPRGK